jgi:3-methyladenine DNA glycosylase AlkD
VANKPIADRPASIKPTTASLIRRLREAADPGRAKASLWFFKTGPGEYGEGDRFLGVAAQPLRQLAKDARDLPISEILKLMKSPWHEARSLGLLVLVHAYGRGDEARRQAICDFYLGNTDRINGWDLVDCSAPHIVGAHLESRSRAPLKKLGRSKSLWERRIAILATLRFIRSGEFGPTLEISKMLLDDREDLIHKAVGWMLREVGKRDRATLEGFLKEHAAAMPRTALRYAIERFPEPLRRSYLEGSRPMKNRERVTGSGEKSLK